MLSFAALLLWMLAIPLFLGGKVWIGLGLGVLAYFATHAAARRHDGLGALMGVCLQALVVLTVIRLIVAAAP